MPRSPKGSKESKGVAASPGGASAPDGDPWRDVIETALQDESPARERAAPNPLTEALPPEPVPLTWLAAALVAALAALVATQALPASVATATDAAWDVFREHGRVGVRYPALLAGSVGLAFVALAAGLAGLYLVRQSATPGRGRQVVAAWVGTAAAALLGLRLREAAEPALAMAWTEPLRDTWLGATPPAFAGIALAGVIALFMRPDSLGSRALAGLGAFGLWLHAMTPVGWAGGSLLPAWAAIVGIPAGATSGSAGAVSAAPVGLLGDLPTLLQVLVATGLLAALALWRDLPRAILGLFAAGLWLPCVFWPMRVGVGATGLALETGASLAAAAFALALAVLHRPGPVPGAIAVDPATEADGGGRRLAMVGRAAEPIAVAVLIGGYLILKINGLRWSTTDEGLYFYAAKAWSEGLLPYRDFFFAHPPLHIAVPALAYKVFGYHFVVGKWLSALAALGAGIAVWRIARTWLGITAGVFALGLDLFACEVLQASTNLTGINLTTCWLMWGLWAALRHRFLLAGMLLGAAAATGFYAIGGFLILAVLAGCMPLPPPSRPHEPWLQRALRHPTILISLGFLAVWGTINAFFLVAAGDAFRTGVYDYHFAKKAKVEGFTPLSDGPHALLANSLVLLGARDFAVSVYYHAAHYWLALLAPLGIALKAWAHAITARPPPPVGRQAALRQTQPAWHAILWHPRRWWLDRASGGAGMLLWVLSLGLLAEFAQFKERYDFYYALLLPCVTLCAATWIDALLALGRVAVQALTVRETRPPTGSLPQRGSMPRPVDGLPHGKILAAVSVMVLLSLLWVPVNMSANRKAFPSEFQRTEGSGGIGERLTFDWYPPPPPWTDGGEAIGPTWLSDVTRGLYWQDHRMRGSIESGVHHYLWSKKRWFSTADDMAAYIRRNSTETDTLTGASDYAPLIALLSGRRLAGNHIDTNSKVFNTGAVSVERFWDAVCADRVKFVIAAPQSYFAPSTLNLRTSVVENFKKDQVFLDPMLKHWKTLDMELWVRKREPTGGEKACSYKGMRGVGPTLQN